MIMSPAPVHETERLADVRALKILDTPPDQRFDRIVRLASTVFDVPVAYVAVIDQERQWFRARVGIEAEQTPRSTSFCGHTILRDEPLIIPDALADERFHDNPMVVNEPRLRFYAGYPLKGPNGYNVATLCLGDQKPRGFSEHDLRVFRELARLAEHELNMVDVIGVQRQVLDVQQRLVRTQRRLERELAEAAEYVRSLLPDRFGPDCAVRTNYHFITSSRLGGDLFGYHWIDDRRLAVYLLDVTGHGIAASLLAAGVNAALSPNGLLAASLDRPDGVLVALNRAFPMEKNGNRFFTIWYGVYDRTNRTLRYASAGHPPAVALNGVGVPVLLGEPSFMIGVDPDATYEAHEQTMPPGSRLYTFSDGVFEARNGDGQMLRLDGLIDLLTRTYRNQDQDALDTVLREIRLFQASDDFADDFSLLEVEFL